MTQLRSDSVLPAFTRYERLNAGLGVVLNQFRGGETVHAYLLTGARGLGKRTFAKVLASALFCTSANKPCGVCAACRRVWDGNEPDLLTLFADDGKSIGVERVRALLEQTGQHAFGGGVRVVLMEPMERMTPQAQNCLLKSLEEPTANVVYLLMTHELGATLGTIASRCVRVKLTPWPDEALAETLERMGFASERVRDALPRAAGNIGAALEWLDESRRNTDADAFAMEALAVTSDAAAVSLSTRLKENRDGAEDYLAALEGAIHQALMVRAGRADAQSLASYPPLWRRAAEQAPISELNGLLRAVFEARRLRAGQVNWQSTIDHLMMTLLEEHTKWQQSLA